MLCGLHGHLSLDYKGREGNRPGLVVTKAGGGMHMVMLHAGEQEERQSAVREPCLSEQCVEAAKVMTGRSPKDLRRMGKELSMS